MDIETKARWLAKRITRAQKEHGLFTRGDRILVAYSGGKDSLALLWALPAWARSSGLDVTIGAVHVEVTGAPSRRDILCSQSLATNTSLEFTSFAADPAGPGPDGRTTHPCFRCGRLRREALLRFAADGGWQKVALGHHLDDDAETVLMNQLHQGVSKGLAPTRSYFDGRVTIVRPLIMAEEKELADLARGLDTPLSTCSCPDGRPMPPHSARQEMKAFLHSLGPRRATVAKRHLQRLGQAVER